MDCRLPIYLVIDDFSFLCGNSTEIIVQGVKSFIEVLQQEPFILEASDLSIVSCAAGVKEVFPLTRLCDVPDFLFEAKNVRFSHLGAALEFVVNKMQVSDSHLPSPRMFRLPPLLFLISNDIPADVAVYRGAIQKLKNYNFGFIAACIVDSGVEAGLFFELTDLVAEIRTTDEFAISKYFLECAQSVIDFVGAYIEAPASDEPFRYKPNFSNQLKSSNIMSTRRLPVYILLDTSGSMRGEPIHSVNVGLQSMLSALRCDPFALESVQLSIITFDFEVKELFALTPLDEVQLSEISVPEVGATFMGAALEFLVNRVHQDIRKSTADTKGDWRPLLFIMTDGSPSDIFLYRQVIPEVSRCNFGSIVACAAGPKAKKDVLLELTSTVVTLDTMDSSAFSGFFKWVSASVVMGSTSAGVSGNAALPPPPPEIQLVL